MTEQSDQIDHVIHDGIDNYEVERHFGDIAPVYSPASPNAPQNAVQAKARGAAERMWRKVEVDLDQLDQTAEPDSAR